MKITSVSNNINFTRQLNKTELQEMKETSSKAFEVLGNSDGKRIFVMPDFCLPQYSQNDTGIGILSSKAAKEYLSTMDNYINYTHLEILPFGKPDGVHEFYGSYECTVMTPGVQYINLELLKEEDYGKILTDDEYKDVIKNNLNTQTEQTRQTLINNRNIFYDNGAQNKALYKAYERFKTSNDPKILELKSDFEKFKTKNKDWLDIYSVYYGVLEKEHDYQWFQKWDKNSVDRNLYNENFPKAEREARLNQIFSEKGDDIEFYNFKQFLAEKHFLIGKENLNKLGKKLITDCPITFDDALIHAYPDAFMPRPISVGYGLPMFNYETVTNPDSQAHKVLMRKTERTAELGDCVRMDVGWQYFQSAAEYPNKKPVKKYFGETLLNQIEQTIKKVKGKDFDTNNIMYEFDADPKIFSIYDNGELTPAAKRAVKIYNSTYTHDDWQSHEAFTHKFGKNKYVLGFNHDPLPMRFLAENRPETYEYMREKHLKQLAKFFNVDIDSIRTPVEFMKAKFAEITSGKNFMHFYMNIFGSDRNFNNTYFDGKRNWGFKLSENYEKDLNKAIQSGFGFNLMDSLEKIFKRSGLDKTHKELYDKIIYFRDELYKPDIIEDVVTNIINKEEKQVSKTGNKTFKIIMSFTGAAILTGAGIFALMKKNKHQENKLAENTVTTENPYQAFAKQSSFLNN